MASRKPSPPVFLTRIEIPALGGLDPEKYLLSLGVERRDGGPLSADDIDEIESALVVKESAAKKKAKAPAGGTKAAGKAKKPAPGRAKKPAAGRAKKPASGPAKKPAGGGARSPAARTAGGSRARGKGPRR